MGVSWKGFNKHHSIWTETLSQIKKKQDPESYVVVYEQKLDMTDSMGKLFSQGEGIDVGKLYKDILYKMLSACENWCIDAEAYMQMHHKWQNRTYAAEGGLTAEIAGMEDECIVMVLYHTVPYGIYLETRDFPRAGRLNIIKPTIQEFSPRLMQDIANILDRV